MFSYDIFQSWLSKINDGEGNFDNFTKSYEKMGFIVNDKEIIYREWAPGAQAAFLIGDFSNFSFQFVHSLDHWDRKSHPMTKNPFGTWEILLPHQNGKPQGLIL